MALPQPEIVEPSLCRCGKPLIKNGLGAEFCDHCDRGCTGNPDTCIDCRLLDRATKRLALDTSP